MNVARFLPGRNRAKNSPSLQQPTYELVGCWDEAAQFGMSWERAVLTKLVCYLDAAQRLFSGIMYGICSDTKKCGTLHVTRLLPCTPSRSSFVATLGAVAWLPWSWTSGRNPGCKGPHYWVYPGPIRAGRPVQGNQAWSTMLKIWLWEGA